MRHKFKVGDKVERLSGWRILTKGGIYVIAGFKGSNGVLLEGFGDFDYSIVNFKLAEANPMPTLEAGMVVKYSHDYSDRVHVSLIVNSNGDGMSLNGETTTHNIGEESNTIHAIYMCLVVALGEIKSRLGEPIWTKAPEKTAQQIKDEKIQAEINKMKENITNLEKELHDEQI